MDFDGKARRARLRLVAIGVGVVAALIAGGLLLVSTIGSSGTAPSQTASKGSSSPASSPSPSKKQWTPRTARHIPLLKPRTNKDGIGMGFERGGLGAISAAVSYWEGLDLLDDTFAQKQWEDIASKDSPEVVQRGVSEVRKLREAVGLPPTGNTPGGLSITTQVKAARALSVDDSREVVEVWMVFDRYASIPNKGVDDNPLKNEMTSLIVKWEDGDWKVTEEQKYTKKKTFPVAYDPDSPFAFKDGWQEVSHG